VKKSRLNIAQILNVVETVCIIWFTIEYLARLWSCPRKRRFLVDILNIIDLASIIPFYLVLFLSDDEKYRKVKHALQVLRVLRIFKLARHSNSLRTFAFVFRKSINELGFLMLLMAVNALIFSSLTYYAEQADEETKFTSMTTSLWWAVVTLTVKKETYQSHSSFRDPTQSNNLIFILIDRRLW
jgi:hypothetical protein